MSFAVVVDFDSRRMLFRKIVEAMHLPEAGQTWDLNWGEPFLALTNDHKLWVRVFYEETLPWSLPRLQHEIERLKPHVPETGAVHVCVPQIWGISQQDLGMENKSVRLWNYSTKDGQPIFAQVVDSPKAEIPAVLSKAETLLADQRLSTAEVRDLAEMGLALKRFRLKTAS